MLQHIGPELADDAAQYLPHNLGYARDGAGQFQVDTETGLLQGGRDVLRIVDKPGGGRCFAG